MSFRKILLSACVSGAMFAGGTASHALAADHPREMAGKMDMAAWHKRMCTDRYARNVGPAYQGAVTHPGAKTETHVYADI